MEYLIETLYILSGTTDLVLATNIDREICHTINSRQLCLMADVSIYTNYLMIVYIRFRRSAGCVSCDVILNSNIDKSYCKYKLIGALLCFLQMNRVFFKMKVWTESGQPIRQFLIVRHFFKTITWSAWPFHMHVISSRPFNNIQILQNISVRLSIDMTSTVLITLVVMETFNMPYCTACKLISLFIAILLTTAIQRIPYSQCNKNEP